MTQPSLKQQNWPVAWRWIAMGTIVFYSAVGSRTVNVLYAQDLPSPRRSGPEKPPTQLFAIPPDTLGEVVRQFETATHWTIQAKDEHILVVSSPGVSGVYSARRALEELLRGTGVTFRITGGSSAALELDRVSTSVDVVADAATLAATSPKFQETLADTPQSISVVPQSVMEEQNTSTLRDALRNVAGISLAAGEGGSQGDNLTIRGFTARNDLFIDGMRDFGSYYRDPFDLQEVEVLQGPSSVDFGRGSTGGVVNQATKAPDLSRFISADLSIGTDLTRRFTADVDTPVPLLGDHTAFRLNVMGTEANVAGRDVAETRRDGFAPSLAFGIGTPTRLTFSYVHQNADDIPDYGIPWLFNQPAPVNRTNYYGFRNGNFLRTYDDLGTIKAEHDLNGHLTLRNQARYANYLRDAQITEAQIASTVTLATPLSSIMITRNQITVNSIENDLDDQLDLIGRFNIGSVRNTLVTGIEGQRENSDPVRTTWTNVPMTSLLTPDENQPFSGTPAISSNVHTRANSAGAYALESAKFGTKWSLTAGLRWDRFDSHYTQAIGAPAAFNRLDEMPTWRTALSYKPVPAGTFYAAAGTSFNPSAESLSLSAATANLPPERNRSIEAGTKWEFGHPKITLASAVFRTDKYNAREPDPDNPLLDVLAGNQRVTGAQVSATGHVLPRWELLGSFAYLDSRVVSSQYYPAAVGAQLANVPRETFSLWNNFRLPDHWQFGAGTNFVGARTASSTAPLDPVTGLVKEAPGYWLFNASVSHPLSEHVALQANVYNIANRYYYDQLHPVHVIVGAGRSAQIGLRFRF